MRFQQSPRSAAEAHVDAAEEIEIAVGGVHEKAIAAPDSGADVFIARAEELFEVDQPGLEARGARDLARALTALQAT